MDAVTIATLGEVCQRGCVWEFGTRPSHREETLETNQPRNERWLKSQA